jgi:hypothetical protein
VYEMKQPWPYSKNSIQKILVTDYLILAQTNFKRNSDIDIHN